MAAADGRASAATAAARARRYVTTLGIGSEIF